MSKVTIILDGFGNGMERNPYGDTEPSTSWTRGDAAIMADEEEQAEIRRMKQDHALWTNFERTVQTLPAYLNNELCTGVGEVEAEFGWRYKNVRGEFKIMEPTGHKDMDCKNCEEVWNVLTPPTDPLTANYGPGNDNYGRDKGIPTADHIPQPEEKVGTERKSEEEIHERAHEIVQHLLYADSEDYGADLKLADGTYEIELLVTKEVTSAIREVEERFENYNKAIVDLIDGYRIEGMKLKSPTDDYVDRMLYNLQISIMNLPQPPTQKD